MLTNEDIKKIVQAHERVFYTKTEMDDKFEGLRGDFSRLQTSVESFAVTTKRHKEEIIILNKRLGNHEGWIKEAGNKIGLEFKT